MRFWTLVFAVLVVVMLAFVPITASSAQAQQIGTESAIMALFAHVRPVGVAVQAAVPGRQAGTCFFMKSYATVKQSVVATRVKFKAGRQRGFRPFRQTCWRPQRE